MNINKRCCECGAVVEMRALKCPECGKSSFEPDRSASTQRSTAGVKAPAGIKPRPTRSAGPTPGPAVPKCDICGRPMTLAAGRNRCRTCGNDVCGACYVARERACRYCFGTTLNLDAEDDADGAV